MKSKNDSFNMLASNFADFTGEEIQMLVEAGAVAVGLGQCRLRVETAAIAMLATVMLMSDNHQTNARTS